MNEFKFNCPHCDQRLEAPPEMTGSIINCPSCQGNITISLPQINLPGPPPVPPRANQSATLAIGNVNEKNIPAAAHADCGNHEIYEGGFSTPHAGDHKNRFEVHRMFLDDGGSLLSSGFGSTILHGKILSGSFSYNQPCVLETSLMGHHTRFPTRILDVALSGSKLLGCPDEDGKDTICIAGLFASPRSGSSLVSLPIELDPTAAPNTQHACWTPIVDVTQNNTETERRLASAQTSGGDWAFLLTTRRLLLVKLRPQAKLHFSHRDRIYGRDIQKIYANHEMSLQLAEEMADAGQWDALIQTFITEEISSRDVEYRIKSISSSHFHLWAGRFQQTYIVNDEFSQVLIEMLKKWTQGRLQFVKKKWWQSEPSGWYIDLKNEAPETPSSVKEIARLLS